MRATRSATDSAFHTVAFAPTPRPHDQATNLPTVVVTPPANQTWRSYYYLGGKRIAMRTRYGNGNPDVVNYLHGDHLGSTSLTTNASGGMVAQAKYYPYGGIRWESGVTPTDYRFTGQRAENFGLYDYGARFYDPYLNRWIQPDTIVPDPSNPQELNRYSYARNNPVRYTDPSGHECVPCEQTYRMPLDQIIQAIRAMSASPAAPATAAAVIAATSYAGMLELGLWAMEDNGPNYAMPDYSNSIIQPSSPLPGTTTLGIDVLQAVGGRAQTVANHLVWLSSGGLQFPGIKPPKDPKDKRDPEGGTENHWLKEVTTQLQEWQQKYPKLSLQQILQKEGLSAEQAAQYVKNLQEFQKYWLDGLSIFPKVAESGVVDDLNAVLQALGVIQ